MRIVAVTVTVRDVTARVDQKSRANLPFEAQHTLSKYVSLVLSMRLSKYHRSRYNRHREQAAATRDSCYLDHYDDSCCSSTVVINPLTTADFETYQPYHTVGIQSRPTPRTAKFFVRRAFLREYIEIIEALNSTASNRYYLFICLYSALNCNLTLTLSFL